MTEWDLNTQRMLDFIELHLAEPLTLAQVARRLGYSPWYCTRRFRQILGRSFRSHLAARRLSAAALELRDGDAGILELAQRWGFASQEAFSRAFKRAFGVSPGAYRRCPVPLPLAPVRRVYLPPFKETPMHFDARKNITVSIQSLPAHGFLGLKEPHAVNYFDFWGRQAARGVDCHAVIGLLDSLPSRNGQIGGWYQEGDQRGYLYGIEVPEDYAGPVPEGMSLVPIPAGEYAVFHHPAYAFETEDPAVFKALQEAMAAWDPAAHGLKADPTRPTYQRHGSDTFGQAFCLPVRR